MGDGLQALGYVGFARRRSRLEAPPESPAPRPGNHLPQNYLLHIPLNVLASFILCPVSVLIHCRCYGLVSSKGILKPYVFNLDTRTSLSSDYQSRCLVLGYA